MRYGDQEDSIIMTQIRNYIILEISKPLMCFHTSIDVWEAIEENYFKGRDAVQIYDLTVEAWTAK